MIPVNLNRQISEGTIEYTINWLVDNRIDLFCFNKNYKNDETGAPAYHPGILLKIILLAYSRGIIPSRKIAIECRENIIFMALSAGSNPDFTSVFQDEFTRLMHDPDHSDNEERFLILGYSKRDNILVVCHCYR
jgi:hypothetical protein